MEQGEPTRCDAQGAAHVGGTEVGPAYELVLFYCYADLGDASSLERLAAWLERRCGELSLIGRVTLASEGINGNLGSRVAGNLALFTVELQALPEFAATPIDFKLDSSAAKPFPDLHVAIKGEICSTGHTMPKRLLDDGLGGTHLSPRDFHDVLSEYWGGAGESGAGAAKKELVIIDVRNNIEFETGRFMAPDGSQEAINPCTKTFARWAPDFADRAAEELKSKKVLMYCTGGIRCEKASAYLRSKGVEDVSQLSGGIHRYLEQFGSKGFFKGANFVFDSRFLQRPEGAVVVARCSVCREAPTEAVSSDRVCAVCRESVLVCDACRGSSHGVYYCDQHKDMRGLYEPFLERFDAEELLRQRESLLQLAETKLKKTARYRSVSRQVRRIDEWVARKRKQQLAFEAAGKTSARGPKKSIFGSNPRCRSCGLLGPRDLLAALGRRGIDQRLTCDGACCGVGRHDYEEPKRTLEQMNDPGFRDEVLRLHRAQGTGAGADTGGGEAIGAAQPHKKRARTATADKDFRRRMREETVSEYGRYQYSTVTAPVVDEAHQQQQVLRRVEPYLFEYNSFVKQRWIGRTLLEVYVSEFSGNPGSYWRRAVELGLIKVAGEIVGADRVLRNSESLTNSVHRHEPDVVYVPGRDMVLHESDRLVVANKPASITVHPSGAFRRNSLMHILAVECGLTNLFPVHRLDRLTSGVVLLAKDAELARLLSEAMVRKGDDDDDAAADTAATAARLLKRARTMERARARSHADAAPPGSACVSAPGPQTQVHKAYLARVEGRFPSTAAELARIAANLPVQREKQQERQDQLQRQHQHQHQPEHKQQSQHLHEYLDAVGLRETGLYWETGETMMSLACEGELAADKRTRVDAHVVMSWPMYMVSKSSGVWQCIDYSKAPCEQEARAKQSMTRVRLVAYDGASDTSLVQCEPVTGRTHQLRVHLAFLGHPIRHDPIYGRGGDLWAGLTVRNVAEELAPAALAQDAEAGTEEGEHLEGTRAAALSEQALAAAETTEELAKLVCVACQEGEHVAFKEVQTRWKGIDLHAYRYKVDMADGSVMDFCTPLPPFGVAFTVSAADEQRD